MKFDRNISKSDIRFILKTGGSFIVDDQVIVPPITINDIKKIGLNMYYNYLNIVTVDIKNLFKIYMGVELTQEQLEELNSNKDIKPFSIILQSGSPEFEQFYMDAWRFLLKDDSLFHDSDELVILSSKNLFKINMNNVDLVAEAIKTINILSDDDIQGQEFKPANEKAAEIIRAIEEGRREVAKKKRNNGDSIEIDDIITAVVAKSNTISYLNVGELTLFQLIDHFKKLLVVDKYDKDFLSSIHVPGSKPQLKHWADSNSD